MEYYKLDGTSIPIPDDFDREQYKITKANRTASGKMVQEIISRKNKFKFKYDELTGEELQTILDILFTDQIFYNLEFVGNMDTVKNFTVYGGAIKRKKLITDTGDWVWTDVSFDLIEQ